MDSHSLLDLSRCAPFIAHFAMSGRDGRALPLPRGGGGDMIPIPRAGGSTGGPISGRTLPFVSALGPSSAAAEGPARPSAANPARTANTANSPHTPVSAITSPASPSGLQSTCESNCARPPAGIRISQKGEFHSMAAAKTRLQSKAEISGGGSSQSVNSFRPFVAHKINTPPPLPLEIHSMAAATTRLESTAEISSGRSSHSVNSFPPSVAHKINTPPPSRWKSTPWPPPQLASKAHRKSPAAGVPNQ